MKKIITGILMLSICIVFAQKSTEEKEKQAIYVKNKVKSFTTSQAKPTIDQNGKVVPGHYVKASKNSLDKFGNTVEEIAYNARGTVDSWIKYEFDKLGNGTEYLIYNTDGTINNKIGVKNEYDNSNHVKTCKIYNSDSILLSYMVNTYNEQGQLIKNEIFTNQNKLDSYSKYEYDQKGRTIKKENYDYNEGIGDVSYTSDETYKYNPAGQLAEKTIDVYGVPKQVFVCKYDAKGLIIGTYVYDGRNKPTGFEKVVYELNP